MLFVGCDDEASEDVLPWAEQTLSPHGDDENSPHKVEVERPELYIDKVMSAHEDEINRPGYSDFNSL